MAASLPHRNDASDDDGGAPGEKAGGGFGEPEGDQVQRAHQRRRIGGYGQKNAVSLPHAPVPQEVSQSEGNDAGQDGAEQGRRCWHDRRLDAKMQQAGDRRRKRQPTDQGIRCVGALPEAVDAEDRP
jgi:hypothetical protein